MMTQWQYRKHEIVNVRKDSDHSIAPVWNFREAALNIRDGWHSRYPICCIMEFSMRHFLGFPKYVVRGTPFMYHKITKKRLEFMPCNLHEKMYVTE